MHKLLAQNLTINGQSVQGPLVGITSIGDIINIVTKFLVPLAVVVLFFVIIWGGYDLLMSQGAPEKIKSARMKLTSGFIGFLIIFVSYVLVKLLSSIFGIGQGIL